jgi:hypothetical protein
MRRSKKLLIIALIIILLAAAAAVYWFEFRNQEFQLEDTFPGQQVRIDRLTPTITFDYNQPLFIPEDFRVVSDPLMDAEIYTRGDTLYLVPNHALLQREEYTLTIPRIESQSGQSIGEHTLTFRTDRRQSSRLQFLRDLPVHNPGYSITYLEDRDTFVVRITQVPVEEKRLRARNYLEKNGIKPGQNDVKFEILRSVEGRGASAG